MRPSLVWMRKDDGRWAAASVEAGLGRPGLADAADTVGRQAQARPEMRGEIIGPWLRRALRRAHLRFGAFALDRIPVVIKGYRMTLAGNLAYCLWADENCTDTEVMG